MNGLLKAAGISFIFLSVLLVLMLFVPAYSISGYVLLYSTVAVMFVWMFLSYFAVTAGIILDKEQKKQQKMKTGGDR